jgi:ketosteroid isomerase-like protein
MTEQTTDAARAARNVELVQAGNDAFTRGDLAAVEKLFRPDAVWHAQRLGALSPRPHGLARDPALLRRDDGDHQGDVPGHGDRALLDPEGVSTRAGAAVFAMEHGLIHRAPVT